MLDTAQIKDVFFHQNSKRDISLSIINLNMEYEENQKAIINVLNEYLNRSKYSSEGLEFLLLLLPNITTSVIETNAINWVNHCLLSYPNDLLRELRLRVLGEIVEIGHSVSDFNKIFVSDCLSKVFEYCISTSNVNTYECVTAVKTLTVCMKYYPNWFGIHKDKIEKFLIQFLDSDFNNLVLCSAKAFHYLQQVGPAGTNNINYKKNFSTNFSKLCRTVHSLLNIWFPKDIEMYVNEKSNNVFEFNDNSEQGIEAELDITSRRICNILKFIESMIKTSFSTIKETRPKDLLYIIKRGLSLHNCMTKTETLSLIVHHSALLLIKIQLSLLNLLRLCIIWYQMNILPFSYTISKILIDSVELFHHCNCFKTNSLYQEASYKTLQEWLALVKCAFHQQFQRQLLKCIIEDISPAKSRITLQMSGNETTRKSQKARKKTLTNNIIADSMEDSKTELSTKCTKQADVNTTIFALKTLKTLLFFTEIFYENDILFGKISSLLIDTLLSIQKLKSVHPYTNPSCQVHLYDCLISIYYQTSKLALPRPQIVLDIVSRGLKSKNKCIIEICETGIKQLDRLCQPICPSLYLVNSMASKSANQDDKNSNIPGYGKTGVSSKNRKKSQGIKFVDGFFTKQSNNDHSYVQSTTNPKGLKTDDIIIVELEDLNENPDNIAQYKPTVTAPSEDGNEILEEGDDKPQDEKAEEQNKTDYTDVNINTNEDVIIEEESHIEEMEDSTNEKSIDESVTVDEHGYYKDLGDRFEESTRYSYISENKQRRTVDGDNHDDLGDTFEENYAGISKTDINSEEPLVKRLKLQDEDDLGDTFIENCEGDGNKDTPFLHEDSFVDEVKEY